MVLQRLTFTAALATSVMSPACNSNPSSKIKSETRWKCPEDMVLIDQPPVPPFCIGITEVSQKDDRDFWIHAKEWGLNVPEALKQPKDGYRGSGKPAVSRTWMEARVYCQNRYPKGDLPEIEQWKAACGSSTYCTLSEELRPSEAVYDRLGKAPADVGSTLANRNGVKDMTGNVGEWTRDDDVIEKGWRYVYGGNWRHSPPTDTEPDDFLSINSPFSVHSGQRFADIGYRCVAAAEKLDSSEQDPAGQIVPETPTPSKAQSDRRKGRAN